MINLLPQSEKKHLRKEYFLRLTVIFLWSTLALEAFAVLVFLPSYFVVNKTTTDLTAELDAKKKLAPPGGEDVQRKITQIQSEISLLKPVSSTPPSELLLQVLSKKPQGISVSSVAYDLSAGVAHLQMNGVSATREELLAFQRNLKENPRFSDIKYSQSFITRKTDIDFQLVLAFK